MGGTIQLFKEDFCLDKLIGETEVDSEAGMMSTGFTSGIFRFASGDRYVGEMHDSTSGIYLDGYGVLTTAAGDVFAGTWDMDVLDGTSSTDLLTDGCCNVANSWCSY